MANKRVHEIAKAQGLPSKAVIDALQADGHDVSSASSSIDEAVALRALKGSGAAPAPARPARPAAAPGQRPAGGQRPVRPGTTGAPARPVRPAAPGQQRPAPTGQRPAAGGQRPVRPGSPGTPARPVRPAAPGQQRPAPTGQRPAGGASARPGGDRPLGPKPTPGARPLGPKPTPGARPAPVGRPVRPQGAGGAPTAPGPQRPARPGGDKPLGPRVIQQPTAPKPQPQRPAAQSPTTAPGRRPAAPGGPQRPARPDGGRPAGRPARPDDRGPRPAGRPARPDDRGPRRGGRPDDRGPRQREERPLGPKPTPGARPLGPKPTPGARPAGTPSPFQRRKPVDLDAPVPTRDLRTRKPDAPKGPLAPGEKPAQGAGPKIIAMPDPATARPQRAGGNRAGGPGGAGGPGRRRVVIDQPGGPRRPGPGGPPSRRPRRRRRRQSIEEALAPISRDHAKTVDVARINSGSTVKDVAEYLGVPVPDVIKKLMLMGEMATLTQTLPDETIELLAAEFEREIEIVSAADEEEPELEFDDDEADLEERPPVVTIMGHVDHGKTSLLDKLRETEIAASEAGGITQHIGAYQVHHDDLTVTFLDTPGHAAFTAMRARGAKITDIVVVVVAADDGMKPQTQEAIDHARAADVPIIVAVNKIDKEGADPLRVRTEMAEKGVTPAEWGGDVEFVDISAKTGDGLGDLLDTIGVVSELLELRANPDTEASGAILESKLDPGRGPVATMLIQRGTLEIGDAIVAGAEWGRVRALIDYTGERIEVAGPGDPVEVLGWNGVPAAGDTALVVESERVARTRAEERATRLKAEAIARRSGRKFALEDVFKRARSGAELKGLPLILKADVGGSLGAFEDEISRLPQTEVLVDIVRSGVGGITESDVMLAAASQAVIIGFNVRPVGDAQRVADREGVEIRTYEVIYKALDDLRDAMEGLLDPEQVEETVGQAEVRQIFRASRVGTIAGSYVTDGKITRNGKARLIRDGNVIATTRIESLRRFQEDAREVATGFECGIVLRDYPDVKEGDVIEVFETKSVERELT